MIYEDFINRVRKAGLSVKEFAELVGIDRRSISNYSMKGEVPNHLGIIALLLAELAKYDVAPDEIGKKLDELGRKPRKHGSGGFRGKINFSAI